mgnify:CR=1 FL=1
MISNYFKTASGSIFFFDDFDVTSAANALARAERHGSGAVTHVFRKPHNCGGVGSDLEALYTERLHIADVYAFKKAS